jgi:hypothetical protein
MREKVVQFLSQLEEETVWLKIRIAKGARFGVCSLAMMDHH